jgi:hypothetical protein
MMSPLIELSFLVAGLPAHHSSRLPEGLGYFGRQHRYIAAPQI